MMYALLEEQLKRHEGLRLTPYRCTANKLTIGYGRNLDSVGITFSEADVMIKNDIDRCHMICMKNLTWFSRINEARRGVVINMVFNLGYVGFSKFKKTISYLESYDYVKASEEMLNSRWAKQVGMRAVELSEQMRFGKYKN